MNYLVDTPIHNAYWPKFAPNINPWTHGPTHAEAQLSIEVRQARRPAVRPQLCATRRGPSLSMHVMHTQYAYAYSD